MLKLILYPLWRRKFFTKPSHILAWPKKYLCKASISICIVRCRKQREPGKAGQKKSDHLAQGNSHMAHSRCSSQPFRNEKELKLFALFYL